MDHVVVPLDPAHAAAAAALAGRLVASIGDGTDAAPTSPHLTLVSYRGLSPAAAIEALRPVAAAVAPFTVRAHGYGMFTGDVPRDLSLHVMVVRTAALAQLHARVCQALREAGGRPEGLTEPGVWTPHITLLDRGLTPFRLARAVEVLARRPHCSWSVQVEAITVGPRTGPTSGRRLPLQGAGQPDPTRRP